MSKTPEKESQSIFNRMRNAIKAPFITKEKPPEKQLIKEKLENFFQDRITDGTQQYKQEAAKQSGITQGYVATKLDKKKEKQLFLLKRSKQKKVDDDQLNADRRDNVTEYIMGGFIMLYYLIVLA